MILVAIAWLYVTLLMALTEATVARGVVTFALYGVFPLSIVLYLLGTPARRRRQRARDSAPGAVPDALAPPGPPAGADPQAGAGPPAAPARPAPEGSRPNEPS